MAIFLGLNGFEIEGTQEEVVTTMFAAAAGDLTEAQLGDWVRAHLVKLV
jgi:prophage maintenance system killer protein